MAMKQFLVGFSKLVLGIFLALIVMSVAGLAAARYFFTRLTDLPERPVFEDVPAETTPTTTAANSSPTTEADPEAEIPTSTPEQPEEAAASEPLPEGAYRAAVTYPTGLIMRAGPGVEYPQTGGVDYEDELVVLQESNGWLKVKTASGTEAWVKGRGNTKRIED